MTTGCRTPKSDQQTLEATSKPLGLAIPQPVFDLEAKGDFFALPFPSNARRLDGGAPALEHFPNPKNLGFVSEAIALITEKRKGFGPYSVVSLAFDGPLPPILNQEHKPLIYARPESPILLINLDAGAPDYLQPQPCFVRVNEVADQVRPQGLLQIRPVPGLGLRSQGTYALIVRRQLGSGRSLGTADTFQSLLQGHLPESLNNSPVSAVAQRWIKSYAPLRAALPKLKLRAEDIAVATVFSIGDPTQFLRQELADIMAKPAPGPVTWQGVESMPNFYLVRGSLPLPMYQQGKPPYLFGGGLLSERDGKLYTEVFVDAPFVLTIPKQTRKVEGFPLYLYFHGTGGSSDQAARRGRRSTAEGPVEAGSELATLAANAGFATACIAGPFSPDRIGLAALDGYAAYNFFHPRTMEANFSQMLVEKAYFLRALQAMHADAQGLPKGSTAVARNKPKTDASAPLFDSSKLVIGGQSLGSYLASMVAASTGAAKGLILTGAGGSWIEFAFGPKNPVNLQGMLEKIMLPRGEKLDRFHPYIDLFELAGGSVDNTLYARRLFREPTLGFDPPHVLVIEGYKDRQVPTGLQRALILAMGIDMLGNDVGRGARERLDTVLPWAALRTFPLRVQDNRQLANGQSRSAVFVRYREDGILEGHYVAFQRPEAQNLIASFLTALGKNESPLLELRTNGVPNP